MLSFFTAAVKVTPAEHVTEDTAHPVLNLMSSTALGHPVHLAGESLRRYHHMIQLQFIHRYKNATGAKMFKTVKTCSNFRTPTHWMQLHLDIRRNLKSRSTKGGVATYSKEEDFSKSVFSAK